MAYKDFAHSPSKVEATTKAVKAQYSDRTLVACLELHTYSSLNAEFLQQYKDSLAAADKAIVFYSPEAVQLKKLQEIDTKQIEDAFQHKNLKVYTNPQLFQEYLKTGGFTNSVILFMSSGNYGGLDFDQVKEWI